MTFVLNTIAEIVRMRFRERRSNCNGGAHRASTSDHLVAGRRRRAGRGSGPATQRRRARASLFAHGEPMVWLTGGGLVLALVMIVGLLSRSSSRGCTTLWPVPLVRVETARRHGAHGGGDPAETFRPGGPRSLEASGRQRPERAPRCSRGWTTVAAAGGSSAPATSTSPVSTSTGSSDFQVPRENGAAVGPGGGATRPGAVSTVSPRPSSSTEKRWPTRRSGLGDTPGYHHEVRGRWEARRKLETQPSAR